jgi:hypothetical protein
MDIVDEPEPGAAMEVGLKVTVTPLGWPLAESAMAELNPPDTVVLMVELPPWPCCTETEPGDAKMLNDGVDEEPPVSAAINPALGLPQPVTRS